MTYDAIIFDSDGVLVEPTDPDVHRDVVEEAFTEFGTEDVPAEVVEQLVEISGDDSDKLSAANVERICQDHGIDAAEYWRRRERLAAEAQRREIRRERKQLYPDIEVVHSLECPLAIVSNNQHDTVHHVLSEFDIADRFDAVYGRPPTLDGIRRRKPETHYAELAIEELDAERPLFVGDSVVDVRTANQLGIDSAFLRREHRTDYELPVTPTYEIETLETIPHILSD